MHITQTPIEYLKGVGPVKADLLRRELNISTYADLLHFYPFRYVDRSEIHSIRSLNPRMTYVQLIGEVTDTETTGSGRSARMVAKFSDGTGQIDLIWFQGLKWVKDILRPGIDYLIFGKLTHFNGKLNLVHPEVELLIPDELADKATVLPVYSSTEKLKAKGLGSKGIGRLVKSLLTLLEQKIPETLDAWIMAKARLMPLEPALCNIHFPENQDLLDKAKERLKFDELFFAQLSVLQVKFKRKSYGKGYEFKAVGSLFNTFYNQYLPFDLTNAQKKVIREIREDLRGPRQMNRLLQGDVGSGKTLVALLVMLIALDNGYQACLMAPTEILARQHYATFSRMLSEMNIAVGLLTGSTKSSQRKGLLKELSEGSLKILIGTHALIEDQVAFACLGLVVIDEQHRFGVEQRARLWSKSAVTPHVLVMTATPIPRTLAMTLYGDLDYSVIDEMPPGRKPVQTALFTDSDRLRLFAFMRRKIAEGRQVYVVYPLIRESEKMDLKDLEDGYNSITRDFPLPEYAVSIVHGKMKTPVKDYEMQRFVKGETQIMVSTTVIEVGVDVPNASVMVVENAERFGLSQLHQLRGRVGRGADQSYCLLMASSKLTPDARIRLETMVSTHDGFEIADADLKLRGPGELEGTRQSGLMQLKLADLVEDEALLNVSKSIAETLLGADPLIQHPANARVAASLSQRRNSGLGMGMIS